MSEYPYMPLYCGDYLADTSHLTAEESGAYMHLLMSMWRHGGSIPNDDTDLARISRVAASRWSRVKARIMPLMQVNENGRLTQKRLAEEWNRVSGIREAKSKNAKSGWDKRRIKNNDLVDATASDPHKRNGCNHNHTQSQREQEATQKQSPSLKMNSVPNGTAGVTPADACALLRKQVWEEGKALFVEAKGISQSTAGGLVTQLVKASNNNLTAVLGRIREARQQSPPPMDPYSWVMARVSERKAESEKAMAKEAEENWVKKVRELENARQGRDVH